MAKTRINRKELRRLQQKQQFAMATQVRLLAEQLPNQSALDTCLLAEKDPERRLKLFNFMKPYLRFDGVFPSTIKTPGIIITG